MRIALDTNILAYLAGVSHGADDDAKISRVRALIAQIKDQVSLVAPQQALGELFVVLRRSGTPPKSARQTVLELLQTLGTAGSTSATIAAALVLAVDHKLQYWDALIVTAAVEAGCILLLSEDMQDGFVVRGMTVANPLAEKVHPKLRQFWTN